MGAVDGAEAEHKADMRVVVAAIEENAYWLLPGQRMQAIIKRAQLAGNGYNAQGV